MYKILKNRASCFLKSSQKQIANHQESQSCINIFGAAEIVPTKGRNSCLQIITNLLLNCGRLVSKLKHIYFTRIVKNLKFLCKSYKTAIKNLK